MASDNEIIAPVYRYFTTDLLSDEVLMEIPFGSVSYERALKAAGAFSGQIPVFEGNRNLDLYESTMPGQTGLYVVRDNVCVWGGIIWSRSYDVKSRVLQVSASEFTSYFHHRLIWKTVNYEYGATVTIGSSGGAVVFDYGSTDALKPGSSVKIEFYDPSDFRYNGYYVIGSTPPPTTNTFALAAPYAQAKIIAVKRASSVVTITTDGPHGFSTGDSATLDLGTGSQFNGTYIISAPGGSASTYFTFNQGGTDVPVATISGTAVRPIPAGVYRSATITTHTDTYDYVRGIVTAVFDDFVGIDFADDYLNPGIRTELDITNIGRAGGWVTVTTGAPHNLAIGQTVVISEVGQPYDGEWVVTDTPTDTVFRFALGGTDSAHNLAPLVSGIVKRSASAGVATITTGTPHKYLVGQKVTVDPGADIDGFAAAFAGEWVITNVPTATTFQYNLIDQITTGTRSLPNPTVSGTQASEVFLTENFETSLDGWFGTSLLSPTLSTAQAHGGTKSMMTTQSGTTTDFVRIGRTFTNLIPGHKYRIDGWTYVPGTGSIADFQAYLDTVPTATILINAGSWQSFAFEVTATNSTQTFYLYPHNGGAGYIQYFDDFTFTHTSPAWTSKIGSRDLTGNVATLGTSQPNGSVPGGTITVSGLDMNIPIAEKALDAANSKATITTTVPHELSVGDQIQIEGLSDSSPIVKKEITGTTSTSRTVRVNRAVNPASTLVGLFSSDANASISSVPISGTTNLPSNTATSAMRATVTSPPVSWVDIYTTTIGSFIDKVVPGGTYTGSVYMRTNRFGYASVTMNFLDSTGFVIGGVTATKSDPLLPNTWVRHSVTALAPAGTMYATLAPRVDLPSGSGNMAVGDWIEGANWQIEDGPFATPFFKGGDPSSNGHTYGYQGAANQSSSSDVFFGYSGKVTLTTSPAHNFSVGQAVTITDMLDTYVPTTRSVTSGVGTITTSVPHNLNPGDALAIQNITDTFSITSTQITSNVVTVGLAQTHGFVVGQQVKLANITESATVVAKEIQAGIVILTFSRNHNMQAPSRITVSGLGAPYDGEHTILSTTETRVLYELESDTGESQTDQNAAPTKANGTAVCPDSVLNGLSVITAVPTAASLQVSQVANDVPQTFPTGATVSGDSPVNTAVAVLAVPNSTTFTVTLTGVPNLSSTAVAYPTDDQTPKPIIAAPSVLNGKFTITGVSRNTFSFTQPVRALVSLADVQGGVAVADSLFNGSYAITEVPTAISFRFAKTGTNNMLETVNSNSAYVRAPQVFNGSFTITSVDRTNNSFKYAKTHANVATALVAGYGSSIVRPKATQSTYGSFPGNANPDIEFSTRAYSGIDVLPTQYRGHELTNVGDALSKYSDTTDGFEYRIDCSYDEDAKRFRRTFVLLPIDFPNPPPAGEASPPSRFGADKLVFEYPGNIIDVKIDESAENAATRFFAVGESGLDGDAADPYSVASDIDLLDGSNRRRWPVLDDSEKVSGIDDEEILYAYAQRYLGESRPPSAKLTVSVNGSLQPTVNNYVPGNWCSLIVQDDFMKMRLASGLEPRDTVIIRKIDSMKVTVPDGTTFPETVDLTLVAEWEVDNTNG